MQPAAASGQEVPQQIVPTQLPLMQSVPRLQAPPLALFARQVVPEQKNPGAQGTLPLQVVAHAVEEAHPKPLQVVAVPAVHVRAVEQVAAGTKVTALVVAVQVAAAHLFVQLPQAAAVMIEVSQPAAVVQSARPSLQVCTHEPVAQLPVEPVPLVHGAPQAPQFVAVLVTVSQPRSGLPAQCARPESHALCGTLHAPETQVTPTAVRTLGSVVQLWPQVPQLSGSVWRFTQLLVHRLGVGATQLDEQAEVPLLVGEQLAVGATHLLVQLPQVAGTVMLVSQPRSPLPEQCANPALHDVGGTTHTPPVQLTGAPD